MRRWIALAWMVMTVSGCDNMDWGGVEVALQAPPSRAELAAVNPGLDATGEPGSEALPELPAGPLLLAGTRDGSHATLVVVGEIQPDGLSPLPPEAAAPAYQDHLRRQLLARGSEFILFSEGVRVGRLLVEESGVDERFCGPRPTVTGVVELMPNASAAQRLLALPAQAAGARERGTFRSWSHDYDQRVASLSLASEAIPAVSAPWPPSLLESRADIQVFRLEGAETPSIAATFLYQDRLRVEEPGNGAYALFLLGEAGGTDYRRGYTWYHRADDGGKGVPRYFSHLDWDGDGESEILLDVFGGQARWYAGLSRRDGSWTRTFQDSCGGESTTSDG